MNFTFALIQTFLLHWLNVPYLRDGYVETFEEIVLCVNVCVFIHEFGQRGGPPMGHGVCSRALCVTLFSLFPLGFLHLYVQLMHCTSSLSSVCIYFFC